MGSEFRSTCLVPDCSVDMLGGSSSGLLFYCGFEVLGVHPEPEALINLLAVNSTFQLLGLL